MNQRKLFFRRIVAANLIMAMLASMNGPVNLKARHITNNYHSAEIITVDDIPNEYLYTRKEKGYFKDAMNSLKRNGEKTALKLNEMKNEEAFKKSLRAVLDEYYKNNDYNIQLKNFIDNIDARADEIIQNYEEAAKERKNSRKLDYSTEHIMIEFDADTSNKDIKKIISYVTNDDNITEEEIKNNTLLDGNIEIDEKLPDYKKERLESLKSYKTNKTVLVDVSLEQTIKKAKTEFEEFNCVVSAESDYKMENSSISNDPHSSTQWYLDCIEAEGAWNASRYARHAVPSWVAVIDSGIDINHPDLKNSILKEYSVDVTGNTIEKLTDIEEPYAVDHGTAVGGVIAAEANNGIGIAGVSGVEGAYTNLGRNNLGCKLMAIKAEKKASNSDGYSVYQSDIIKGIDYAVLHGAEVINISISFNYNTTQLQNAIDRAYAAKVSVVASTGNEGKECDYYPACCEHVIAVGASNENRERASFSNYGHKLDIMAPGNNIITTTVENKYITSGGTSFSAPIVAAVLAQMYSVNYKLTPDEREDILYATATDIGTQGYDKFTGHGLVNAKLAVQFAKVKTILGKSPELNKVSYAGAGKAELQFGGIFNEDAYVILREEGNTRTTKRIKLAELSSGGFPIKYIDTNLTPGKTYTYYVACSADYGNNYYNSYSSNKITYTAK